MTCCPTDLAPDATEAFSGNIQQWVRLNPAGLRTLELIVPGICEPSHIQIIEKQLKRLAELETARVNLSRKGVSATWRHEGFDPARILQELMVLGFVSRPIDPSLSGVDDDALLSRALLRAVAVSGFAAANVMLLSVSVWSGAEGATRDLFHWISAAIALPTVAYAGRPFFRSAVRAVSSGQMNMDVPISLAVCLAALMSLFETFNHGETAYFDASVTLLFFLLTGRYLDHLMRARARSAISQMLSLASTSASILGDDGIAREIPADSLGAGMTMLIAAGERLAADGIVAKGESEIERSVVTGETLPVVVRPGSQVLAGMLNLTGPLHVKISAAGQDTFLSEVVSLLSMAEQNRSRYVRLADRLARVYSPAVHVIAGLALGGWLWRTGGDWHTSLMVAMAVLVITCPCALGLAVPAVHVVASSTLFRRGAMIKDGAALEKLASVDTVIFDKTGTLTLGRPRLIGPAQISEEALAVAAGLAQASRHPLSKAICDAARERDLVPASVEATQEHPGRGLSGRYGSEDVKMGSRAWCGIAADGSQAFPEFALVIGSRSSTVFTFEDQLRPDARKTVDELKNRGIEVRILSGDRAAAVRHAAVAVGIEMWQAEMTPKSKLEHLEALKATGRKVLMVGDGLNDAPALAAGTTSMAPSSATDIGRTAADTVFFGDSLSPIIASLDVSKNAERLSLQNFLLAAGYNLLAVPIAAAGLASPLIAAIAMSTSSIIVIANSLRLGMERRSFARSTVNSRHTGSWVAKEMPA